MKKLPPGSAVCVAGVCVVVYDVVVAGEIVVARNVRLIAMNEMNMKYIVVNISRLVWQLLRYHVSHFNETHLMICLELN